VKKIKKKGRRKGEAGFFIFPLALVSHGSLYKPMVVVVVGIISPKFCKNCIRVAYFRSSEFRG
jgi:hypothetical protein